jgi:hypothetical protein
LECAAADEDSAATSFLYERKLRFRSYFGDGRFAAQRMRAQPAP